MLVDKVSKEGKLHEEPQQNPHDIEAGTLAQVDTETQTGDLSQ